MFFIIENSLWISVSKAPYLRKNSFFIEEGIEQKLSQIANEVDFFTKFGGDETENAKLSNAHLLKGLGLKGLGKQKKASENLKLAISLSASNLYAMVEFNSI